MDKEIKIFAIVAAVMMLAVAGIALSNTEGSDATVSTPTFGIKIGYGLGPNDTVQWTEGTGNGENAIIAVVNYLGTSVTADTTYNVTTPYTNINANYGKVTKIGDYENVTNGAYWHAFYYSSSNVWVDGSESIGFYKPYSDYDAAGRTANIALFYGTDADAQKALNTVPTTNLQSIVQVPQNANAEGASDYAVTFTFTYSTASTPCTHTTTTLTGYGSDVALALKNAMVGQGCSDYDIYLDPFVNGVGNTNYGYVKEVFDVRENSADLDGDGFDDTYWYWSTSIGGTATGYLLGFYSPVHPNQTFVCTSMTLDYVYSTWATI